MRKNDTLNEIDEYYAEKDRKTNSSDQQKPKAAHIILIVFIMIATLFIALIIMLFSDKITPRIVLNFGLSAALLLGLCLLIIPPVFRNKKKNRCTVQVTLRCIDLNQKISYNSDNHQQRTMTYAPVWEYRYNGNTYIYAENVYGNVNVPPIGSEMEGTINPDDPYELYRPNPTAAAIILFLGIIITIVGVFGLIIINLVMEIMNRMDSEAIFRFFI